jgi:hypothetical protein
MTEEEAPAPGWSRPLRWPLALPPIRWGQEIHIGRLYRLWGISQRALRRFATTGLLPGRQDLDRAGPPVYWFAREDVERFVRCALLLRQVKPGMVIRCAHWQGGRPMRVIDANPTLDEVWEVSARSCDGVLMHAPPCSGDHVVLVVPPDQGGPQRRAYEQLGRILARHGDLTPLVWSLDHDGTGLIGRVVGRDAYAMERAFAEWQRALCLTVQPDLPRHLSAATTRGECRIAILAILPPQGATP